MTRLEGNLDRDWITSKFANSYTRKLVEGSFLHLRTGRSRSSLSASGQSLSPLDAIHQQLNILVNRKTRELKTMHPVPTKVERAAWRTAHLSKEGA